MLRAFTFWEGAKSRSSHTTNHFIHWLPSHLSITIPALVHKPASSEIFPWEQEPSCFSVEGKAEADSHHSCGRTNAAPSALRRSHGILHPSLLLPNP